MTIISPAHPQPDPTTGPGLSPAWYIAEAVAEQAAAHPDRCAISGAGGRLSYDDLVARAMELARHLRALGVGAEIRVASCLPRGVAVGVAALGVWLARGAYVPLDPDGPPGRLAYMIRDSGARVIISMAGAGAAPAAEITNRVELNPDGTLATAPRAPVPGSWEEARGTDLAYVIYTSGSTGRPKGVLVEHRNLTAMAEGHEARLFSGQGRQLQQVALNNMTTADSFFSDFVHLAYGRTLHVVDALTRRDPDRLAGLLRGSGIEMLDATPTQVRGLLIAGHAAALAALRILVVGAEPTSAELWAQLRELSPVAVHNLYGPTECTVAVTAAALSEHMSPVIGTPLAGTRVFILDGDGRPVPDGQVGELTVTGIQVARGYLSASPADASRFALLRLPGSAQPSRAYRTGDRARWTPNGQLEFLGRADDQVSVNGHRVELGEIEARLRECPEVLNAAVQLRGADRPVLTAWYVPAPAADADEIRGRLARVLPAHMMPALIPVPEIPMGSSGKADLAALPAWRVADPVPPEGAAGRVAGLVAQAWQQELLTEAVADSDDFFDLGGDSFKATRVILTIRESLDPDIPIRTIFDHPRFGAFCAELSRQAAS
jgi:amino acid adenylation domain-containing protein